MLSYMMTPINAAPAMRLVLLGIRFLSGWSHYMPCFTREKEKPGRAPLLGTLGVPAAIDFVLFVDDKLKVSVLVRPPGGGAQGVDDSLDGGKGLHFKAPGVVDVFSLYTLYFPRTMAPRNMSQAFPLASGSHRADLERRRWQQPTTGDQTTHGARSPLVDLSKTLPTRRGAGSALAVV